MDTAQRPTDPCLVEQSKSTQRLAALSKQAKEEGLFIGQPLADALSLLPGLKSAPLDRQALAEGHKALARFCQRFSPCVGLDGEDGLTLDIRGLPRLYGGEETILNSIKKALEALGLTAHLAIADTKGAAWALAHYGRSGTILPPGTAEQALRPSRGGLASFP